MSTLKTMYIGGISHEDGTGAILVASTFSDFIFDVDGWFFEYFHASNKEAVAIPPLDDWQHSQEDNTYWSIAFPSDEWTVWVRREDIGFK